MAEMVFDGRTTFGNVLSMAGLPFAPLQPERLFLLDLFLILGGLAPASLEHQSLFRRRTAAPTAGNDRRRRCKSCRMAFADPRCQDTFS